MIRRDSGRSKFISLLMVLTMVFSMIMPMGVWAVGGGLEHDVEDNLHIFTPLSEGYVEVEELTVTVTTTGSHTNVTVEVDSADFLINGVLANTTPAMITTTPAMITTTTPATFTIEPVGDLEIGEYNARVTIKSDEDPTGVYFDVTQFVGPASTNIIDISGPGNKIIVGDYLVDLNTASDKFTLNNFIKMSQTAYNSNPSGYPIYHIYYYTGEDLDGNPIWVDLVTMKYIDPDDIEDMNGDGQFVYTDEDLWLDSEVFIP